MNRGSRKPRARRSAPTAVKVFAVVCLGCAAGAVTTDPAWSKLEGIRARTANYDDRLAQAKAISAEQDRIATLIKSEEGKDIMARESGYLGANQRRLRTPMADKERGPSPPR